MFILSIIPLSMTFDSDGVQANTSNQVDVTEHTIMELEALLSSLIIKQYTGTTVEGVDNTSITAVRAALEAARAEELALMSSTSQISDNNTQSRLDFVNRMEATVDIRINDLSQLLTALNEGSTLDVTVSGVDNTSIISVTAELERVLAYKQELTVSKTFWNQIISAENTTVNGGTGEPTDDGSSSTGGGNTVIQPIEYSTSEMNEAISRRKIANLQAIISSVSQNTDVNELLAQIDQVTQELKDELRILSMSQNNTISENRSSGSVSGLQTELKTLFNQKEIRELMAGVESSVRAQLVDAFNELSIVIG